MHHLGLFWHEVFLHKHQVLCKISNNFLGKKSETCYFFCRDHRAQNLKIAISRNQALYIINQVSLWIYASFWTILTWIVFAQAPGALQRSPIIFCARIWDLLVFFCRDHLSNMIHYYTVSYIRNLWRTADNALDFSVT